MKKTLLVVALAAIAGIAVAQPYGGPGRGPGYAPITAENFATAKQAIQTRIATQRESLENAASCVDKAATPDALQACMQSLREERRQAMQGSGGTYGHGMGAGGGMGYGPRW